MNIPDNCIDCAFHSVQHDPDPYDSFCHDDVKVVCCKINKEITVACRPYRTRHESSRPKWCPLVQIEKVTVTESKPKYDDKVVLFEAADGPEMLRIYTSDHEGVVDWCSSLPGLYIEISLNDVYSRFGPFALSTIREKLEEALGKKSTV